MSPQEQRTTPSNAPLTEIFELLVDDVQEHSHTELRQQPHQRTIQPVSKASFPIPLSGELSAGGEDRFENGDKSPHVTLFLAK